MLFEILTILPLIAICVDGSGSNHEAKHAVSTQSYHRGDVPLSYKYTSVHIYTTPNPEQKPLYHQHKQGNPKFHTIQYAPLEQNTYQNDKQRYKNLPEQTDENKDIQILEQFQHLSETNGKEHLEPRAVAENFEQNYKSFIPGHNIEVLQSNRAHGQNDLYRAYNNNLQNHQVNIPNFVQHRQPEQHVQRVPENYGAGEQRPLSGEHNILYTFLPRPNVNTQPNAYAAVKPHNLHQAHSAKIPRLHLNIARVYGIAHLPQQAPVTPPYINRPNVGKPPTYTQAIFLPLKPPAQQKTILYPVQDTNKNYPVHT